MKYKRLKNQHRFAPGVIEAEPARYQRPWVKRLIRIVAIAYVIGLAALCLYAFVNLISIIWP